jgi:glycosyltransferase involved in cell wall biosynthesis
MVFEVRDLWPQGPIALGVLKNPITIWLARWLERFAYRNAVRIIALAPGMKDGVAATGYDEERITVIPNGCDMQLFESADDKSAQIRAEHDWLRDWPLVSYIGALGRVNAVDYLAQLASRVQALDPEIRFVVIGEGAQTDFIRDIAQELGVLGINFFMLPRVSKSVAAGWFSASTIATVLATGPRELLVNSTANKYFDGMAAGRPLASNYRGWQIDIAVDAGAAIVLDNADYELAAKQLVDAIADEAWLNRAAASSRDLAKNRFSRDSQADTLESVLLSAVGR